MSVMIIPIHTSTRVIYLLVAAIRDPGSNNIFFFLIEILIAISPLL
jgi:hypothetical protein